MPSTGRDRRSAKLWKLERESERRLEEIARGAASEDLPGQGRPLADDDPATDRGWAARHVLRQANAVPEWADLRKDIDARVASIGRRLQAHREWLHGRARLLGELPADRIVEAARATGARDLTVRAELETAVGEVNALIRRYDLLVVPAMQLPQVTLERLGA